MSKLIRVEEHRPIAGATVTLSLDVLTAITNTAERIPLDDNVFSETQAADELKMFLEFSRKLGDVLSASWREVGR